MKILLLTPPNNIKPVLDSCPPMGLGYIAAYLQKEGHTVQIWDGMVEKKESLLRIAKGHDLFGIQVLTNLAKPAHATARLLKTHFPNVPIVMGGCHITALPFEALENPAVDFAVVSEGEITMTELCSAILGKIRLEEVLGICFRDSNGKIKCNPKRPFIELNSLLLPKRCLFRHGAYGSTTYMITSRGCPNKCTFCSEGNECFRTRSVQKILEEIKTLKKAFNIKDFTFMDNLIFTRRRVEDFCNGISRMGIRWACYVRVDALDASLLKLMKKSGCYLIMLGIESGDDSILKGINKGITTKMAESIVKSARKAGIRVLAFFILGHVLDTPKTIEKTIRFAIKLDMDSARFGLLDPYPGTKDYETACMQDESVREWWKTKSHSCDELTSKPIFVPRGMSSGQLVYLRRKAYRSFYFRPKRIFRKIFSMHSIKELKKSLKSLRNLLKM